MKKFSKFSKKDRSPRKERSERPEPKDDRRKPRFSKQLVVLHEDDALIVLDKPAGLLAVPIKGSSAPSALSLLVERLKAIRQRAMIVHRIDRFSSGALVFAKTRQDREALIRQFLAHTPKRQYFAVVRGRLNDKTGKLVHYFRRDGMYQHERTSKDPKAARAELRYTVERLFADATLVRVELVTGLQNQIRAQFAAMGHPLIGDRKYSAAEASEKLIDRVALHATRLEFVHPRTKKTVAIESKLPADFQHLVRVLSKTKPRE